MTPAIKTLERAGVTFQLLEYEPEQGLEVGLAAARALGLPPEQVLKTLIATLNSGALVAALVPVSEKLNMKLLARVAGAKSAAMADTAEAERITGYVTGGISPIGQKKRLPTYLDGTALDQETVYVSAGRRGLELALRSADLVRVTQAEVGTLTAR